MRSIGQRATSAAWVSWSIRAWWVTAAIRSARKCAGRARRSGPVDLGADPQRLELLDHRLEIGVGRLHLEQRLHRVEAGRRAHSARLGGGGRAAVIRRVRARPVAPEPPGDRDQLQAGVGGAAALVAGLRIGADPTLRMVLDGQDAVADRDPFEPEQGQSARLSLQTSRSAWSRRG